MAVRIQKQELQECSSSGTMYTAVGPDESHNLSQVTRETDRTSSTARRCHDRGNLGYDASNENAGGLAADSPSNGLLASLPSTRARARRIASDGVGSHTFFPFRSIECDFRFQNGHAPSEIPRLTESGYELELEYSVEAIEKTQKTSSQTYGDVIPLREEERLLNRDKSEELPLTQAKVRWSSVLVHR